ncbi:Hypothetical predicted protein [Mytilus galloprovincialis]|uniref:C-type lectin domain-containing protein n=1 Tax=Mytilus galloprovincialis TaxID=29158 RepID=A0A8B6F515_MYTGA|nr:Hypothetical predicted protein [Mytilus galloprovincialis]
MIFKHYKLTLVLAALTVQAIQSKKCKKGPKPNEVTCNDPQIRNCGNASIYIDVGDKTVGAEAHLSCSNGYTLWGNDSIVCLDSGQWSQQNAYCIPDNIGEPNIQSFDGSLYLFNNFTKSNYSQAKAYCTNICSTLIEINNQEEDQFLLETMNNLEIDFLWIGLESINGGNYSWPSGNTTQTNQYENWFDNVPQSVIDNPAAGSCVQAFPFYDFWLPNPTNLCDTKLDDFVCELRIN